MGIIRKHTVTNSILSYVGMALGYVNLAILFPRLLGDEVFGLTQVLLAASALISSLGSLGLNQAIIRYFPIFKTLSKDEKNPFVFYVTMGLGIAISVSFLALFLFKDVINDSYSQKSALFVEYSHLLYPLLFFTLAGLAIDHYSRAIYRTEVTALLYEVGVRLANLFAVLAYFLNWISLEGFLIVFSMVRGFYVISMLIYLGWINKLEWNPNFFLLPKSRLKDVSKYAMVTTLSMTAGMTEQIEVLILGSAQGLVDSAMYSIVVALGSVITITSRALNRVATASIADGWNTGDLNKINRVYAKSALNNAITSGFVFVLVMINLENLFEVLPDGYEKIRIPLIIFCAGKLFHVGAGLNASIIQNSSYYRMNLFINIINVGVHIALSIYLIKTMDILGAAIASFASSFISNIIKSGFLYYKFKMNPIGWGHLWSGLLILTLTAIGASIPQISSWWIDGFMRSLLFSGVFLFAIYQFNISKDMRDLIDLVIKKVRGLLPF